jgi:16S rRNA G527 N7-methylase RsmG
VKLNTKEFGILECEIETNGNSSVDAFISRAFSNTKELSDEEIDYLNTNYSEYVQSYSVEELGCYWD